MKRPSFGARTRAEPGVPGTFGNVLGPQGRALGQARGERTPLFRSLQRLEEHVRVFTGDVFGNCTESRGSHYLGISRRWDEWVPEERTLKLNDENLKRQKDLEASMKASSAAAAKKKAAEKEKAEASAAESAPAAKQAAGSNNKRKRENTAEKVSSAA